MSYRKRPIKLLFALEMTVHFYLLQKVNRMGYLFLMTFYRYIHTFSHAEKVEAPAITGNNSIRLSHRLLLYKPLLVVLVFDTMALS